MRTRSLARRLGTKLVLRSLERAGRIRSAERTEVHLVVTTSFHELTFCPSMRTLGEGKEVRHAGKTTPTKTQPRSPEVPGKRLAQGSGAARFSGGPADSGISSALLSSQ